MGYSREKKLITEIGLTNNQIQNIIDLVTIGYDFDKLTSNLKIDHDHLKKIVLKAIKEQMPIGELTLDMIMKLKADGWGNKKIAHHFGVSEGTIRRAQKHKNAIVKIKPI